VGNQVYVGIGLNYADGGMTYEQLVQLALDVRLGAGASNAAVVDLLYTNVVGVAPDDASRAHFVQLLDSHSYTQASLGVLAADIGYNLANIDFTGLSQHGLAFQ
jgi:hypothetical protein